MEISNIKRMWNTAWPLRNEGSQIFLICKAFYEDYPDTKTGLWFYSRHMMVEWFNTNTVQISLTN